ncbi:hypothetical protein C2S51_015719 [Perilla frutescens var. frutescens]|nr:hypothetical protein C2S51_015719 [Perilla frutescens var. frutescens]
MWLESIRKQLDPANQALLSESCLGVISHLPSYVFHAIVYQELLMRLDRTSLTSNTLRFVIHEETLQFGPMEFGLMCGLKFKGWYAPPVSSAFHDSMFDGRLDLTLFHLQDKFRMECVSRKGSGSTCLRLAWLNILYGVLLCRGPVTQSVDMEYFHLIDNDEAFKTYLWGSVAYDFLVRSTYENRDHLLRVLAGGARFRGDIIAPGLSIALLLWAYEVMPDLAALCGTQEDGRGKCIHRLPFWSLRDFVDAVPMSPSLNETINLFLKGPCKMAPGVQTCSPSLVLSMPSPFTTPPANIDTGLKNLPLRIMGMFWQAPVNAAEVLLSLTWGS